ncbi:FAD-dependent oxidoreductase [Solicola gregarius]|uniref:FAD-dependent oxidoreductase n=1 Tax=Solicola gregarius TaxID=2908642 RepID=A0AA46YJH1_9ACTN|nr:FAD-dependent oxidoreductase [Solicola gregarius]UYM03476.1 FAD-dependent oxidoreductase [Solicola gregarius]
MGTRRRVVVVGGDAAGMAAAATAKRRAGDDLEIIAFERGSWTSYSACGIPYWVGGEVPSPDDLVARTPEEHRRRGIDVRMGVEVTHVDADDATVRVRDSDGVESSHGYDELILATGAEPYLPDLPGIDSAGIHTAHTLDDGQRVLDDLLESSPRHAVVVGGGYVGLEMAESFVHQGVETTLVTRSGTPMSSLDPDVGGRVHEALERDGVRVRVSSPARGFASTGGRVSAVETDDAAIPADIVVLGIGVRARSGLATAAGLEVGAGDAIVVDSRQRADPERHIWAAGDCAATHDRMSGRLVHVPLGTHANKQGVVLGRNLTGDDVEFPGVLATAITKACSTEIARTGLGEQGAADAGFDAEAVTIETTTRSGYYPGAEPMSVKLIGDRTTRRVLGAQIIGGTGAAMRIDTVAMALWSESTVDDLMFADLAYAPPFSSVWDPVQVAARALASRLVS